MPACLYALRTLILPRGKADWKYLAARDDDDEDSVTLRQLIADRRL